MFILQTENPTVIQFDGKDYTFEGFSMLSHHPLEHVSLPGVKNYEDCQGSSEICVTVFEDLH